MRWLIDYDSTLANTLGSQIKLLNEKFGRCYTPDTFHSWTTEECIPSSEAGYMWGSDVFGNLDFQATVEPVEGAIEGLKKLLEHGEQCMIISDRSPSLYEVTRMWLDKNGLHTVPLLFTYHKSSARKNRDGAMSKYQAAWLYKLKVVVEDSPHHAEMFASKSWVDRVYLLDQPYNRHVEGDKIIRCQGWKDAVAHVFNKG